MRLFFVFRSFIHSIHSLPRTMKYANFLDAVIFFPSYVWISDDTFNVRFMNLVVVSIDVMYMCMCIHKLIGFRIPVSLSLFFWLRQYKIACIYTRMGMACVSCWLFRLHFQPNGMIWLGNSFYQKPTTVWKLISFSDSFWKIKPISAFFVHWIKMWHVIWNTHIFA